jgi:predicted MFS family arabinose efflux permease
VTPEPALTHADAAAAERSYRAVFRLPGFLRMVTGMQLARIANQMVAIAIVLFVLERYRSPALAGLVTFLSLFPGLLLSPISGALLDRHGRKWFIVLDYSLAWVLLTLIGVLALLDALPVWALLVITFVSSLTGPLSTTGSRTLFPLMVPRHLWERANAVDSNGYVLATLIGPPVAGAAVGAVGGPATLIGIGVVFGLAAIVMLGLRDPETNVDTTGNLWLDAWRGFVYCVRNPTLRGLAFTVSIGNLAGGISYILVPVLILRRLHEGPAAVGIAFAMMGLAGVAAAFAAGRMESEGRERAMMSIPLLVIAVASGLLWFASSLWVVLVAMALVGIANGPYDIALFTLRQKRTDPAWMGRAFAVSMALNFVGVPIGSAIGGPLVGASFEAAIGVSVVVCLVAAAMPYLLVPAEA